MYIYTWYKFYMNMHRGALSSYFSTILGLYGKRLLASHKKISTDDFGHYDCFEKSCKEPISLVSSGTIILVD